MIRYIIININMHPPPHQGCKWSWNDINGNKSKPHWDGRERPGEVKTIFLIFSIKCISHRKVWYLFPQVSIHDKEDQTTVRECICWDFLLFYVSIIIFIPDHGITFPNIYLRTFQGANKLKIYFSRNLSVLMIRAKMWPYLKIFFVRHDF